MIEKDAVVIRRDGYRFSIRRTPISWSPMIEVTSPGFFGGYHIIDPTSSPELMTERRFCSAVNACQLDDQLTEEQQVEAFILFIVRHMLDQLPGDPE